MQSKYYVKVCPNIQVHLTRVDGSLEARVKYWVKGNGKQGRKLCQSKAWNGNPNIFLLLLQPSPVLLVFWWITLTPVELPRHFTSPLSLWRDLFITLDLNDFFSSTNAELCLSPTKIDHFPQSGFQGLNLFVVFHQYFFSSQYKVLLTMWAVWWWCRL